LIKMDHVSITVRNVDRSIKFYSEALGMKLLRVSVLNPSPETKYRNAYMYSGSLLLEIITAVDSAEQEAPSQSWQQTLRGKMGITHLGVRVSNLDAAVKRLKAAGARMIGEPFPIDRKHFENTYVAKKMDRRISYVKRPGKRIAVFSGPDGEIIELAER
jgi:catechol 2,3-dioxygenase-like lactoylglutathione lyase family enzyme